MASALRRHARRAARVAIALALLLLAALAAPFLVPLDRFIPQLTRIASNTLGEPVAIDALALRLLPTPRAVASGVRVGAKTDLFIGQMEIVPELLSFISGSRAIRLVRATRVEAGPTALSIPARLPKAGGAGEAVSVRRITLQNVLFHHPVIKLPQFDLDASLAEGNALQAAQLRTGDDAIRIGVQAAGAGAQALDWKLSGNLYGGTLEGSVRADWSRKQWRISGSAKLAGVELAPLQQMLGKPAKLTGRLQADVAFSAHARSPERLVDALVLQGPFEVLGGAYHGYDLSKVGGVTKLSPGGSTSFDELKGRLELRARRVKLADLCARSPRLVAGGHVEIAPDLALAGKLDVSVAKTGGFVGVPIALGGTASEPSFRPTTGYLVGAGIGTVLLPIIGTSIGASLGSRLEGGSGCK